MFIKTEYYIHLYGTHAAQIGERFQGGFCYRQILNHGKRLAQLETVLDNLVVVTLYDLKYLDTVLKQLEKIGFKDCLASLDYQTETTNFDPALIKKDWQLEFDLKVLDITDITNICGFEI